MTTAKYKDQTIAAEFWIALTLREGTAPLRSYVGQVQAVDANGVRLTLIDWVTGSASGYDLFVPWSNIEAALIATPEHDAKGFGERAAEWKKAVSGEKSDK